MRLQLQPKRHPESKIPTKRKIPTTNLFSKKQPRKIKRDDERQCDMEVANQIRQAESNQCGGDVPHPPHCPVLAVLHFYRPGIDDTL